MKFSDQTIMKEIDESFIKKDFIFLLKNIKLIRINSSIEPLHFDEMILSKIVPLLIKICTSKDFSEQHDLIYECTWIISNGLSGNSNVIKYFIEEGVIAALKAQINSEKLEIREQVYKKWINIFKISN